MVTLNKGLYPEKSDYGVDFEGQEGVPRRAIQARPIEIDAEHTAPTQKQKKKKALSVLDQLILAEETPLDEPLPLTPEVAPEVSRAPASSGMNQGLKDALLIGGAGLLGGVLGGGDPSDGAAAGAAGIKQYEDRKERDGAAKLKAYLANKKSTSTKYQKDTYLDKDGKSRRGRWNPAIGKIEKSANDDIVPSRQNFEEYSDKRHLTHDLKKKLEDTKYVRGMAKDMRTRLKSLNETNLKAEKAFELLGSGQLQDKVAVMSIVKELEGRMTDADREYYSGEIAMLKKLQVVISQQKDNNLNPRLLQEAEHVLRNSISKNNAYIDREISDAERVIKAEGITGDIKSRLPNIRAAKLGETMWVRDPKNPDRKIRLKKSNGGWEMYGEE